MDKNGINNVTDSDDSINLSYYFYKALGIWYWFVISVAIFFAAAHFFILQSSLEYEAKASLLVEDSDSKMQADDMFSGFGLFDTPKKIENEIAILSSYQIAEKTVLNNGNFVKYYKQNRLRKDNIYKNSPFLVIIDTSQHQLLGTYEISFNNGNIKIEPKDIADPARYYCFSTHQASVSFSEPDFEINTSFDTWTNHDDLNIKIIQNPNRNLTDIYDDSEYFFSLRSLNNLAQSLMNSLTVEPLNKQADVINISLKTDNSRESVDLLNSLIEQYFYDNLSEKNRDAISTIDFIDDQLGVLSDSLTSTESRLEDFKKSNKIVNIDAQSSAVYNQLQLYESQLAMANLKMKYFEYLKGYITQASDYSDILVPSIMDINDPMLNSLINSLLELNSEKIRILSSSTASNPLLNNINKQTEEIKKAINESVNSLINSTSIEISELKSHISQFEDEISRIPGVERTLLGIQRSFTIDNEIYTYLLKKRAESAIAKASNAPDGKVIDPAKIELVNQTRPRKLPVYAIFILIGLVIPLAFIVIRRLLFDYIESREDLRSVIELPEIGTIPHSKFDSEFILRDHPRSFVAEAFRYIRTNIQFMLKSDSSNAILITSSMPKEGKTFISINFAYSLANTGKKVVLVGGDLRNPALTRSFSSNSDTGLSTYLIGKSDLSSIINKTDDEHLDVIYAGPIPPNPSELIGSKKMEELLSKLKEIYDFVIIDSPPINLTTEAIQLFNKVDTTVYVVRSKYTRKGYLENIVSLKEQQKINNFSIAINDVSPGPGGGYSYKYSYRYAKNYGYYNEPNKKGYFKWRLFSSK